MHKLSLTGIIVGTLLSISTNSFANIELLPEKNISSFGLYFSAGLSATSFGAENQTTVLGGDYLRNDYVNSTRKTHQDLGGMLGIGYDFSITPTFMLGIETRWLPSSSSLRTLPEQVIWQTDSETITAESDSKISMNANSAQLLLKPEFFVATNQYVYALLGTGYAQQKLTTTIRYNSSIAGANTLPEIQASKIIYPLIYGMGYTQFFISHLSFFAEVTDIYYPSIDMQQTFASGAATPLVVQASSVTINSLAATVGLTYHFNGF